MNSPVRERSRMPRHCATGRGAPPLVVDDVAIRFGGIAALKGAT